MRYGSGHKEASRARLLDAAGRGFRKRGYGGIGVDGLAKEAGVTSGAFYGHFQSKEAAFEAVVAAGLEGLRARIELYRAERGEDWADAYIDFYLDERRTCDLAEGCALQTLTAEIGRGGPAARQVFEREIRAIVDAVATGLTRVPLAERQMRALALLALLSGAVTMARAVSDPQLGQQIADAARGPARALVRGAH